jgi:hypothetical protein
MNKTVSPMKNSVDFANMNYTMYVSDIGRNRRIRVQHHSQWIVFSKLAPALSALSLAMFMHRQLHTPLYFDFRLK